MFRELVELLSRFCESLLAELQAEVVTMSFACALGLFCVLRSNVALPIWLQADMERCPGEIGCGSIPHAQA